MEWEGSEVVEEQEGKGVALKSCTQFFQWLKTADEEEEAEAGAGVGVGPEEAVQQS